MQEKTTRLSTYAQQVGLKISQKKTEVMLLNVSNPKPVQVNGEDLPTTKEFTYLSSTVRHDGRAGGDIKNRLNKARNAFRMLNNLLARCNQDSMETIIMRRRWRWIGHVMRREQDNITRTSLHWTPEGKRKRRRPRNTGTELWRQSSRPCNTPGVPSTSWAGTDGRGDPL
ncbi:uncharacterized protein [Pocillopora verrucosa]|uniref:uncharacterized protein n=1 Tax=Pocillopora verrucosa TaxID=203993 RepID=UPI00333F09B7